MAEPIVAGVAESDLGETPDRNWLDNAGIATVRALEDAGLALEDVDGVAVAGGNDYMPALVLSEYLDLEEPSVLEGTEIGGSSFESFCGHIGDAMARGRADVVVIAYGSTRKTGPGRDQSLEITHPVDGFVRPTGLFRPPGAYAMAAQRHMHEYGTTEEQLAEIAVSTREWASMNPKAAHQDSISVDDVLESRQIAEPFNLLDCCLVSDGGGAVVLASEEKARELGVPEIAVSGVASTSTHRQDISEMPDMTTTGAAVTGPKAFEQAGITPDDVDVAQLYDSFTYTALVTLEDLGFCEKGEGGSFVEGGTTAPGGELPMNTQGGGLSYCHPGHFGVFVLIEAVRQLRGDYTGDRQVDGAEVAVAHGTGGILSSSSTVVLRREA
ncbi:acetyl-CoA acetyltransferase [Natronorubrum daqingense]|uniref:Acetyl-CoA acetyltransferase n=1 Tax=Natronorubrum daqingense TaxID=588898 RepID=A0A1N7E7Q7_9EURY|nr:acetyl-CoA acetyltransferase [Natronorubrum daqingense]APX96407.1 thiolase [Natronorubrum daqingense]SIR84100.1 Acetyl-CoA acetyltransferase [Natronorubrum daqingense]